MGIEFVGRVKEMVGDPTKAPRLRDLIRAEAEGVLEAMRDEQFSSTAEYSLEELAHRLEVLEARSADLARGAAIVGYWWSPANDRIVPEVVARLANALDRSAGIEAWLDLYLVPAVLILYANGVAAVIGCREAQLGSLFGSPTFHERGQRKALAVAINATTAVAHERARQLPGYERHHTPMSDRLCTVLAPLLEDLEPDPVAFEWAFDRFEYLLGLVVFDLSRQTGRDPWAPVGRFSWRRDYGSNIAEVVTAEAVAAGGSWPLVRAGLFGGDPKRLAESATEWSDFVTRIRGFTR